MLLARFRPDTIANIAQIFFGLLWNLRIELGKAIMQVSDHFFFLIKCDTGEGAPEADFGIL